MGKKVGMTQRFDDKGNVTPCTVIEIEPNVVVQLKTTDKDGYEAIQLGFQKLQVNHEETLKKRVTQPLLGHFKKADIAPRRFLSESRVSQASDYALGQEIGVEHFDGIEFIDARSVSKGKGYQGVIKRHHFAGGPAAHGSGFHRHGGSTGMRTTPGRNFPGTKKPGHMGHKPVTVQNLKIVHIDKEKGVILVKGTVPGPVGAMVKVTPALKS
jgi:large subunit ribosomal protein L3